MNQRETNKHLKDRIETLERKLNAINSLIISQGLV